MGPRKGPAPIPHRSDALPADCLTKCQLESMLNFLSKQGNCLFWRWPSHLAQTPQTKSSWWQWSTHSAEAKLKVSEEQTLKEVPKFYTAAKLHLFWCLQYLCWPLCLSSHHVMHVHCLLWEYSVKTIYSNHQKSAQHKWLMTLMGIPPMLTMMEFWMGGVDKRYLVWMQLPHQRNQKDNSP